MGFGLAQAATMPERFEGLVIMKTWLHQDEYEYTSAFRDCIRMWHGVGSSPVNG